MKELNMEKMCLISAECSFFISDFILSLAISFIIPNYIN